MENNNFILTHNRDETYLRKDTGEIQTRNINGVDYKGPVDSVSGGTWIYFTDSFVVCVLNGAYANHIRNPPYRKSRGWIILDLLNYGSIDEFIKEIDLSEIEPFTMLMIHRMSLESKILVWDSEDKFTETLSHENLIVRSSSTLYSIDEKSDHQRKLESLQKITPKEIVKMHQFLKMPENEKYPTVMTTSITQIIQKDKQLNMKFCPIKR